MPPPSGEEPQDRRTKWISRRIKEAIGKSAQERINVDSYIKTAPVARRLEDFFSGWGPRRIMFFVQQTHDRPSFGDLDDEPEWSLHVTDGVDTKLRGKCIYFLRRAHTVDAETRSPDLDMLCGEVNADILETFHQTLNSAFLPLLHGGLQDWGKNEAASTKEYLSAVIRFDEMLADAVSSLKVHIFGFVFIGRRWCP